MAADAAEAGLLLLGADHNYYARVSSVVVFPGEIRTPVAEEDWEDDGLSDTVLSGQAWRRGPTWRGAGFWSPWLKRAASVPNSRAMPTNFS